MEETKKIWMDGKFVDWADAKIHILSHTLHYGLGLFEGIRCYKTKGGSAIFRFPEHMRRLYDSAKICGLTIPFTQEELMEATVRLIHTNELEECYIRPTVYLGYGTMGVSNRGAPVNVGIAVWPWGAYLGEDGLKKGIRVKISSFTRHHVNVMMTKAKVSGNYANAQLAKMEALNHGYDEALMLDTNGYVAEGSGENVFMVRGGLLKTTPLTSVLGGITRDSVIELARDNGVEVVEQLFTRDELYCADEAFLTGTAAELTPIREVDGHIIGAGEPGPVTTVLQKAFFDVVQGNNPNYKKWLYYV
jgi:branched-chain amino acid aminotransferase